jgi:hypothetical protein
MSTATEVSVPAQRTAPVLVWDDLPSCSFNGDPVPDMAEHAIHCGDCYAYHCLEN